jgi:hypothetical protein
MTSNVAVIEQDTAEAVEENGRELSKKLDRIGRDPDLSESAKDRYSGEATREVEERHHQIVEEHERSTAQALERNEKSVFRLSYTEDTLTESQKESFCGAYRDSSFRSLNPPGEDLSRLMGRAGGLGNACRSGPAIRRASNAACSISQSGIGKSILMPRRHVPPTPRRGGGQSRTGRCSARRRY